MKKSILMGLGVCALALGGVAALVGQKDAVEAKAAPVDYSHTIRVYVDLTWDGIDYVRIGGTEPEQNAVLSSSNPSAYNSSYGKYVRDIESNDVYEKMGVFFSQGDWYQYQYDNGYVWIDYDKFAPGYEFKIHNINYASAGDGKKYFSATPTRLGRIGQTEATAWAESFVSGVGCSPTYNAAPTNWDDFATSYSNLTVAAKSYLAGVTGDNNPEASAVEKAVFMYDMAIGKYAIDNFMSEYRSSSFIASPLLEEGANNSFVVPAVIGSVVLATTVGFFVARKRKLGAE